MIHYLVFCQKIDKQYYFIKTIKNVKDTYTVKDKSYTVDLSNPLYVKNKKGFLGLRTYDEAYHFADIQTNEVLNFNIGYIIDPKSLNTLLGNNYIKQMISGVRDKDGKFSWTALMLGIFAGIAGTLIAFQVLAYSSIEAPPIIIP